jgi:hypothetical protein
VWGDILNDFLLKEHNADGSLKETSPALAKKYELPAGGIPESDLTAAAQLKLLAASYSQPVVYYDTVTSSWPARPANAVSVVWQGPIAADPHIAGVAVDGDIWRAY